MPIGLPVAGSKLQVEYPERQRPQQSNGKPECEVNGNGNGNGNGFLTMAELEKRHILSALTRCKGNRTHAAKMLEISIRTLRNKLHEYNGDVEKAELAEEIE